MPWVADLGRDDIPAEHVGMIEYRGTLPTVDTDEPGFGMPGGQAFMVEMGAGSEPLRTHFHVVDQFQVFVHGSGRVGRHPVSVGMVHYADRLTPYGPLTAGAGGLSYVTLRAVSDTGAYYMPDRRDDLRAGLDATAGAVGSRRNLTFDLRDVGTPGAIEVVHRDDDGLCVEVAMFPAGATNTFTELDGSGAFVVVLDGEIVHGDATYGPGAIDWRPAGDVVTCTASRDARVAVLQLPAATAEGG